MGFQSGHDKHKASERRKNIFFFGFSRKLYKDVPDIFDQLKKLFVQVQQVLDKKNPVQNQITEIEPFESNNNELNNSVYEASQSNVELLAASSINSFFNYDPSILNNDLFIAASSSQLDFNEDPDAPKWFKWTPNENLSGDAKITLLKNQKICELKYHIADLETIMQYTNEKDVNSYLSILKFAFKNFLESKKIDYDKTNKNNLHFQIYRTFPIKFSLLNSYHSYTILDFFKLYFEHLTKSVEGNSNSLLWLVMNEKDYARFHNTVIHTAIDLCGLELISESDFYERRNVYDFLKTIQFQLDIAVENLFSDRHHAEYSQYRRIVKSFGIIELESENIFEVELFANGSSNVYTMNKDKKVLIIRNHFGDHVALAARKNQQYDPEIIRCYKALMNYIFRYILDKDSNLKTLINSKDYCYEISNKDPTKFHFKGDVNFFDIREVICKYFQFISGSVSKITQKNARKLIISTMIDYDIFRSDILLDAIKLTGYDFMGQCVYDYNNKKTVEDKLEILFNKMRLILNKDDLATQNILTYLQAPNLDPNDKEETFSMEIFSYDDIKVGAYIDEEYLQLSHHTGDVNQLTRIDGTIEDTLENKKDKDDIYNFIKLIKFGFAHISKSCTENAARKFNSSYMKIRSKNPIKFTLENSPIEYTMEDLFVKYFTYMSKSVSRKTKRNANKVVVTLPPEFNILQKSQLKSYMEKADLTVIKILSNPAMKIMALEFETKFKLPGKYALIDMNSKSLTVTVFDYKIIENPNIVDLKDLSEDDKKVQISLRKSNKFKILTTLHDANLEANKLQEKIENYLLESSFKLKEICRKDPEALKNYCSKIQEQFNEGKTVATLQLDSEFQLKVELSAIKNLLNEYSSQANRLLEVALNENNLNLEADVVRVDYTCRLFSWVFGEYLITENNSSAERFNCIDGLNTYDILEYLNNLQENAETISDCLTSNIGFAIAGGIFDMHLRRNTPLPCSSVKKYITAFDYQTELLFPLYMGERPFIRHCESLGRLIVKNIPRSKAGEVAIEVTLLVDKDERLNVTVIESKYKRNLPIDFEFNEVYESKGVQMILDAIKYKEEDAECEKKVKEFKNLVRDIRIKYKSEYKIREEMNSFMNNLNKLSDIISLENMDELYQQLQNKIKELNIKV